MNAMAPPPYAEFGMQSNFSFLRGASRPEELVVAARLLGYASIGLADRNSVAGVVRAWQQAKVEGLAYHPGCRLVFCDGTPDMLAYPRDRKGWGHLCRMLTQANLRDESEKGAPRLYLEDLVEWGDGLSLAVLVEAGPQAPDPRGLLARLKQRFGDALRLAVAPDYGGDDRYRIEQAAALATATGLKLMATNDVLYHSGERRALQDVLTAIRLNVPVAEAGLELRANAERHLKPAQEMARLFRHHPEALAETLRFAGELGFSLSDLEYNYPDEPTESGLEPQAELERLTWEGARQRYPGGVSDKVKGIIRHELATVQQLNYARYFLTVHDIVKFAKSEKILCQGRGSAANSVICYCLGITDVGPEIIDVLFERFISAERNEPPDIDVDFEHERRDEVIAYIYQRYSQKRTALAASVVTYRGRSALREVAKALGLSDDVRDALAGSVWGWGPSALGDEEAKAGGLDRADPLSGHVIALANEIMGFPRHLSQHVGGFVITRDRLDEIVPIVKTAMDERKMVEWDKDDLDAVKILKVDILALGMLSCLNRAFLLLRDHYDVRDPYGRPLELATIPPEDPRVYDMICRADTLGVFQIEVAGADVDAAAAEAARILRSRHRGGDRPAGSDPGRHGASLSAPPAGQGEGGIPEAGTEGDSRQDARRAAVPGTGDEDRHRRRRLQAGHRRRTAPRHGDLQAHRHDRQLPPEDDRRHADQWLRPGFCRALLQADRRLWRIRLSRKPCGVVRAAGLCLVLVQDLLSGCVLRRDPEFAADGLLCPGPAGARCARPWRRDPRWSTSITPAGTARWRRPGSTGSAFSTGMPRCAA